MQIPPNIAYWLQERLYLITLSGYSADAFACAKEGALDDDPNVRWQFTVDMIYRGVQSGLMHVWLGQNKPKGVKEDVLLYIMDLARYDRLANSISDPDSNALIWFFPEIYATDLCISLIEQFDIENLECGVLCKPFMVEIETLFDRNGVGWSDVPLIKVSC